MPNCRFFLTGCLILVALGVLPLIACADAVATPVAHPGKIVPILRNITPTGNLSLAGYYVITGTDALGRTGLNIRKDAIDFTKETLLVAAMGEQTLNYAITINEIRETDARIIAYVTETPPITRPNFEFTYYPNTAAVIARTAKRISFMVNDSGETIKTLPILDLATGADAKAATPQTLIATSEKELTGIAALLPDGVQPPQIDFTRQMAAAVFLGNVEAIDMGITNVVETDDHLRIIYSVTDRQQGGGALRRKQRGLYALVVLPLSRLRPEFVKDVRTISNPIGAPGILR